MEGWGPQEQQQSSWCGWLGREGATLACTVRAERRGLARKGECAPGGWVPHASCITQTPLSATISPAGGRHKHSCCRLIAPSPPYGSPHLLVAPPAPREAFLAAYLCTGIYPDVRGISYCDMQPKTPLWEQVAYKKMRAATGWAGGDEATGACWRPHPAGLIVALSGVWVRQGMGIAGASRLRSRSKLTRTCVLRVCVSYGFG